MLITAKNNCQKRLFMVCHAGGLTPRGSGLSGPAHSRQLGSPRDTIPSITAQRADTAASGHSEISTPSKLVALAPATPAVQPISRQPDAAGSIQAGVLHGRGTMANLRSYPGTAALSGSNMHTRAAYLVQEGSGPEKAPRRRTTCRAPKWMPPIKRHCLAGQ